MRPNEEFHAWLLQHFGEGREFSLHEIQQVLDDSRKTLINLITTLRTKRLVTRVQLGQQKYQFKQPTLYVVHREPCGEVEEQKPFQDDEQDQWLAMVREQQQWRRHQQSFGFRL